MPKLYITLKKGTSMYVYLRSVFTNLLWLVMSDDTAALVAWQHTTGAPTQAWPGLDVPAVRLADHRVIVSWFLRSTVIMFSLPE